MAADFSAVSSVHAQVPGRSDSAPPVRRVPPIGIYEKALDVRADWDGLLGQAANAAFDFLEMSLDDAPHRMGRLDWSRRERANVRAAARRARLPIKSMTLSAHRRYPLGSADPTTRLVALDILRRAVILASDLGVELIQIAGYFTFSETRLGGERSRFVDGLKQGAEWADKAHVTLGLENVDGEDVTSIGDALSVVGEVGSHTLFLYPDVGNLAANRLDVCAELKLAATQMVAVQLKDTRHGEFRHVPFGAGVVPFSDVFASLSQMGFGGPFVVEMWNDAHQDPSTAAAQAREWVLGQMAKGGLYELPAIDD